MAPRVYVVFDTCIEEPLAVYTREDWAGDCCGKLANAATAKGRKLSDALITYVYEGFELDRDPEGVTVG